MVMVEVSTGKGLGVVTTSFFGSAGKGLGVVTASTFV